MTLRTPSTRRRQPRHGSVRRAQGGVALRGFVVATGLAAAVALQVAGSRLQSRLAGLVGISALAPSAMPAMAPASMPSCGSPSGAFSTHPCKVATATAAPVI